MKKNKKIIVAIDVDEVSLDFMNPLLEYHNDKYGTSLKREDFKSFNLWETWGGTRQEAVKKVYDFFNSPYSENIKPIKGSQESINILSKNKDLVIATSRPGYLHSRTIGMLSKYYSGMFKDFYFTYQFDRNNGNRKKNICLEKNVDFIIDDVIDNVLACSSVVKKAFLFDSPWNQINNLPENVGRVHSWKEVLKQLG